jgi:hypothetical protein
MKSNWQQTASHFPFVPLAEAMESRSSRHRKIVTEILSDLERLDAARSHQSDAPRTGEDKSAPAENSGAKKAA